VIRVERTVTVDRPVDEVAKYLSDFRTTEQWDPHTARCEREDTGPLGVGSRFVNTQRIGPLRSKYTYEITEFEPGRRVVLHSKSGSADLTDSMSFAGDANRSSVTYVAEVQLKGVARAGEPLFRLLMNRLADDGARGMKDALHRLPTALGA
jgi:carbon monoxide dehydrogenase subunit G